MAASRDNEVIVQHQPKMIRRRAEIPRHGGVGVRRRRVAGEMIMHHNQSLGTKFKGSLHHVSGMGRCVINGVRLLTFRYDHRVFTVEAQHAEFLDVGKGNAGTAAISRLLP